MKSNTVHHALQAFVLLKNYSAYCREHIIKQKDRISDQDSIGFEVIQCFVVHLLMNMVQKHKSSNPENRRDSYLSAYLCAIILIQFMPDKKKNIYK